MTELDVCADTIINNEKETIHEVKEKKIEKLKFTEMQKLWDEFRNSVAKLDPKPKEPNESWEKSLNEPLRILNEMSSQIEEELNRIELLNENMNNVESKNESGGDSVNWYKEDRRYLRLRGMQYGILYEKAKLMYTEAEEDQQKLREEIVSIMRNIKDYVIEPEMVYLTIRLINHISSMLLKEGEFEKVISVLEQAEELDIEYDIEIIMQVFTTPELFNGNEVLVPKKETTRKLHRLMTNNLDMLAFSHQQMGHEAQHAYYTHQVLRYLLEMKEGDVFAWASKASKLALFFASKGIFKEARHHLCAATKLIQEYESLVKPEDMKDDCDFKKWEGIQDQRAQLAKAWVRYGLVLFNVSKTRLVAMHYGEASHVIDNVWVSSSGELYEMNSEGSKEQTSCKDDSFDECLTSANDSQELSPQSTEPCQVETERQGDGISLIKSVSEINSPDEESARSSDEEIKEKSDEEKSTMSKSDEESKEKSNGEKSTMSKSDDGEKSTISKSDTELDEPLSGFSSLGGEDEGTPEKGSEISTDEIEMMFPTLEISEIEDLVRYKLVETQAEAEDLYNFINTWIKHYREYFDFNTHPTEFVNTILDKSELFRYLAFFSEEIESQYKIQKKRSETLESLSAILREMRPECYIAAKVEILRELAEVQLELMALNLQRLHRAHSEVVKEKNSKETLKSNDDPHLTEDNEDDKKEKEIEKDEKEEIETKNIEDKKCLSPIKGCKRQVKNIPKLFDLIVVQGSNGDSRESSRHLMSFDKASKEDVPIASTSQSNLSKQEKENISEGISMDNEERKFNKNVNEEQKKAIEEQGEKIEKQPSKENLLIEESL